MDELRSEAGRQSDALLSVAPKTRAERGGLADSPRRRQHSQSKTAGAPRTSYRHITGYFTAHPQPVSCRRIGHLTDGAGGVTGVEDHDGEPASQTMTQRRALIEATFLQRRQNAGDLIDPRIIDGFLDIVRGGPVTGESCRDCDDGVQVASPPETFRRCPACSGTGWRFERRD